MTHVLGDVAVHPLINEACGELLLGRRTPLWGAEVAVAHMRVETGLDALVHARNPGLERALPRLHPGVFDGRGARTCAPSARRRRGRRWSTRTAA